MLILVVAAGLNFLDKVWRCRCRLKMRMKIMMGRLYGRDIRPQTKIGHFWVWMADCVVWCGAVRCSYPIRMEAKDAVWTALADWMYLRRMQ